MGKQRGPQSGPPAVTSTPEAMMGAWLDLKSSEAGVFCEARGTEWTPQKHRTISYIKAAIQALEHCSWAHWDTVREFRLAAHEYAEGR